METLLVPTAALTQLLFPQAAKAWLDSRRPFLAKKTLYEYSLNLRTLSAFFGELRLQEIDGDLVRAFQRMRQQQNCGPSAINHELNLVCQMRERIGIPLADYQPINLPKEERGRALSHEERERLFRIAQSNPNWEAAYLFAVISVNTSAGPKETCTLRFMDVDLSREVIRVQPGGAKNVHRVRTIPLNAESLKAIRRAMERSQQLGATEPHHYIFPFRVYGGQNPKHDPTRHQTTFKTAWTKLRATAQLPGFRMYDLRHHAITSLLENPDVSEETVEDIAGHVSRRMKKRYSHIRMEYKRAAVESMLENALRSRPTKKPSRAEKSTDGPNVEKLAQGLLLALAKIMKTG
jgi:integrase